MKLEGLEARVKITNKITAFFIGAVIPKLCLVQTEKQASRGSDEPAK